MTAARPTLRNQLWRRFLALAVLPVLVVLAAVFAFGAPVLEEHADTRHHELAQAVREQVRLQLQLRERVGAVLAGELQSGALAPDRLPAVLARLLADDRSLQAVYVADRAGRVVQAALAPDSGRFAEDLVGLDQSGQPHLAQARRERRPIWSDTFLSTMTGQITAVLAVPAGADTLLLELSLASLSQVLSEVAHAGASRVVVIDRAGRVVAHPDAQQARQQRSLRGLAPVDVALGGGSASGRVTLDGSEQLAHAVAVPPLGWAVMVVQPLATVVAPALRLAAAIVAVLLATGVVATWIGWHWARATGDEVVRLADAAVAEGDRPSRSFSTAEFEAVWTRLTDLFQELNRRDRLTRAAQRDLQAVLDAATEVAIVATDRDGRVTVFNIGAQRLLGLSEREVVGRLTPLAWHDPAEVAARARELGHPDDSLSALFGQARQGGQEVRDWTLRRRGGGAIEVSQATTAVRGADGEPSGFLAVAVDITERRRAQALETARRAAELASQAKSDFLSRMSHELRTPLNAILGYAQLMAADAATPRDQRKGLDQIQTAGWHLVRLIDDALDLASIESGRLTIAVGAVDAGEAVRQAIALVAPLASEREVELSVHVDPGLRVRADSTRLTQVLVNLLSNAAKYNRRGGRIEVEGRAMAEGGVALSVGDTGIGMSPAQLERLFEPFNRLGMERSTIEGNGIGLVITRHLVGLMEGRLEVHSERGVGSRFTVVLPPAPLAEPAAGAGANAAEGADAVRARVLYVEDNEVNVELMRAILRRRPGVELAVCGSVAEAAAALRQAVPDLVLLDLHLPDGQGDAVLTVLEADARLRAVPVVVVSADATPASIESMRRPQVRAYLTKPLQVPQVLAAVDDALVGAAATIDA